ncbi:hypothetical protein Hte_009025 [Hypoxylon texense]
MLFSSLLPLVLLAVAAEGRRPRRAIALAPDRLPAIEPGFDFQGDIENGLKENLPFTKYRLEFFTEGEMPLDCKNGAEERNYSTSNIDVFKVFYEDCGQPWIMCRHKEADIDADEMATVFGEMPLGMREFVKHVMVVKPEGLPGAAALSAGDSIYISDTAYKHFIFAHEISHSIDSHQEVPGVTPAGQGGLSSTDTWREEYSKDSATTSPYAHTSWAEKIHHQYATYQTAFRDLITPRKKPACTARQPDSPLVHADTGRRVLPPPPAPAARPKFKVGTTATMGVGALGNQTCVLPHPPQPKVPVVGRRPRTAG